LSRASCETPAAGRPQTGRSPRVRHPRADRWHTRRPAELLQAVGDFERAVALDPDYALAYAGLADVHLVLPLLSLASQQEAYPRARVAAEKALALDPSLAEAHNSDAYVRMYLDWDFAGAERGFRKAIELNRNYATAHQWYAELLSYQRRHAEAIGEIRIALDLDPLSAVIRHQAGQTLQQARRYDEAIEEYETPSRWIQSSRHPPRTASAGPIPAEACSSRRHGR
jgi:tetratricopeptide (TPR) repeat protein